MEASLTLEPRGGQVGASRSPRILTSGSIPPDLPSLGLLMDAHVPASTAAFPALEGGKGKEEGAKALTGYLSRKILEIVPSTLLLILPNLVMWPHRVAKEALKGSLYSGRPCGQLRMWSLVPME